MCEVGSVGLECGRRVCLTLASTDLRRVHTFWGLGVRVQGHLALGFIINKFRGSGLRAVLGLGAFSYLNKKAGIALLQGDRDHTNKRDMAAQSRIPGLL